MTTLDIFQSEQNAYANLEMKDLVVELDTQVQRTQDAQERLRDATKSLKSGLGAAGGSSATNISSNSVSSSKKIKTTGRKTM